MPSIHIYLRSGKDVAVSDTEIYSEAAVEEILNMRPTWAVTRTDGTRLVIPVAAVEYVVFPPNHTSQNHVTPNHVAGSPPGTLTS